MVPEGDLSDQLEDTRITDNPNAILRFDTSQSEVRNQEPAFPSPKLSVTASSRLLTPEVSPVPPPFNPF